jgi:hypothetical protein
VIGSACFWTVYLAAEAGCADGVDLPGGAALRVALLATAAASVVATGWFAWRAWRLWRPRVADPDDDARFAGLTGLLLAGLFTAFIALLAGPVVGSSLC